MGTRVSGGDEPSSPSAHRTREDASLSVWWRRQRDRGARGHADHEHLERLSAELLAVESNLVPLESYVAQKDDFLKRLQHTLSEAIDGAEVQPFGSVVNGFWTSDSDLDICV